MKLAKILALVACSTLLTANLLAQDQSCCPQCGVKVCQPVAEVKKEKKTVFKVECKEICIPKVRMPWQMCREPQCGVVKKVKVLKKESIECEKCGYRWEVTNVEAAPGVCDTGPALKLRRPLKRIGGICLKISDAEIQQESPKNAQLAPIVAPVPSNSSKSFVISDQQPKSIPDKK